LSIWREKQGNKEVKNLIGIAYPAANRLVSKMEEHGILREFTGRSRNWHFRYEAYIMTFLNR